MLSRAPRQPWYKVTAEGKVQPNRLAPLSDALIPSRRLFYAGLIYLAFVIYGSLVPLDFHYHPFAEAWRVFSAIRYRELGIESRADWVANILLMIPLSFVWLGVIWRRHEPGLQVLSALLILAACIALSVFIEFAQVYFPPRTVSINDIVAETLGALIGVISWIFLGPGVMKWLAEFPAARGTAQISRRLLYLYLFGFFFYNLLPLDLTLSLTDIYDKWRSRRINIVPFGFQFKQPAEFFYGLTTDIVLWVPIGFLWGMSSSKPAFNIWIYSILCATLLEFMQLFVFTRVSDTTDIIIAATGTALGLAAALRLRTKRPEIASTEVSKYRRRGLYLSLGAAIAWLMVIIAVFWYPFDFHGGREFLVERWKLFNKVPFQAYYFGTEYRAATEVLHKTLFFFPLGVLFGVAALQLPITVWRRIFAVSAALFLIAVGLGIELGQLFLPGKNADTTDWFLQSLGGLGGLLAAHKIGMRLEFGRRDYS
jgi:glycopeptide antibiotics resistance protein